MYNSPVTSNKNTYPAIKKFSHYLSLYYPQKTTTQKVEIPLLSMNQKTFTHIHRLISTTLIF